MKPLFLSLIALFTFADSHAQKFEFGANGGIGFNNAPKVDAQYGGYGDTRPSDISMAGSIEAKYLRHSWEYGIKVEYRELSYKEQPNFILLFQNGIPFNPGQIKYNTATIAKPAIPVKLFMNRRVNFHRLETYGGISAGYVFVRNAFDQNVMPEYRDHINGSGFCVGLQLGGSYFVTRHIGVNADVSGDYMNLDVENVNYRLFAFFPSLGIRYKL